MSADILCLTDIRHELIGRQILSAVLGKRSEIVGGRYGFTAFSARRTKCSGCLCIRGDSEASITDVGNGTAWFIFGRGRLDKAVEAARANGGKVLRAGTNGEHGFRVVVIDSEGNARLHSTVA